MYRTTIRAGTKTPSARAGAPGALAERLLNDR
jgi:hypothetical protein